MSTASAASRISVENDLNNLINLFVVGTNKSVIEWINLFLTDAAPDASGNNANYTTMINAITYGLVNTPNLSTTFRLLITESDGTVVYDQAKSTNLYSNINRIALKSGSTTDSAYVINENHNTRPEIIVALQNGQGTSIRFSKSVNSTLQYVAVRVGNAINQTVGCVRASTVV